MDTSSRLHEAAFKHGGYHQGNFAEVRGSIELGGFRYLVFIYIYSLQIQRERKRNGKKEGEMSIS